MGVARKPQLFTIKGSYQSTGEGKPMVKESTVLVFSDHGGDAIAIAERELAAAFGEFNLSYLKPKDEQILLDEDMIIRMADDIKSKRARASAEVHKVANAVKQGVSR